MIRLGQVLLQPGGLRSYIRWKPFSITSFTMLRAIKQQGLDFQTVIDGGANVGQFSRAATEIYPHAKIIAFEVSDHHQLGQLLRIGQKLEGKLLVAHRIATARTRSLDRARRDMPTPDAQEKFR